MEPWRSPCPLSRRRALGLAATGMVAALGVAACQPPPTPVGDAEFDALLTDWTRAVRDRDRGVHDPVWAAADPEFADRLATSLFGLGLTEFSATRASSLPTSLPSGARGVVEVTWQLPGDRPQHHLLSVVVQRVAGAPALAPAGVDDGADDVAVGADPAPDRALPLWWVQSTVALLGQRTGLLVGGATDGDQSWVGTPLSNWQHRAEQACEAVYERTGRLAGEDNRVWFELPSSADVAQRILGGVDFGAVAALAIAVGVSQHEGEQGQAPIHVILYPPELGALPEPAAVSLLTHEAVHVVTRAPHTLLPVWVEEGWAETVAWADRDATGWGQAAALLERIRADHEVIAIPGDDAFGSTNGDDLTIAYALAWTLCRWMLVEAQRRGADDDGWALMRQWYDSQMPLDGSRGVSEAEACTAVFQLSPQEREQRWRDWLIAKAEQR